MAKSLFVIGFGSVGQAWYRMLTRVFEKGMLTDIKKVSFWAPEIKEFKVDGVFEFNPCPFFERATLVPNLDKMAPAPGDVVIELATRIDTKTIWMEVKKRGCHFLNSGFDVWPDVTLDLAGLDELMKDPMFSKGTGMTSVFSFGCNPGIASHFVRHGLTAATGLEDTRAAAKAFGLRAVSFNERDTQWGKPGSEGEKLLLSTQCDVLYNTWSPGNYIVETAESTILYAGCPEEAKTISSAGPAVIGWVPSGPNIGFLAPHDETFTIQQWFDEEIPAVFVYEAPPTARAYIKGGRQQHSSVAKATLLTPAKYDLGDKGYDMLGALLFSNKPGVAPFWCGITLDVEAARLTDPTGSVGPTPFQVTGGLFSALQFVLQHPNSGDCFPEDVPTPFVVKHAFPWAGAIIARPAPEALGVASLFDPGSPASLAQILAGEPKEGRTEVKDSAIAGKGVFAAADLAQSTALTQLSFDVSLPEAVAATQYNHACGDAANAYVDRNRAVRTSKAITAGTEITIDYSLYQTAGPAPALSGFACACKAGACRGTIGDATTVPAAERKAVASTFAIIGDEALLAL